MTTVEISRYEAEDEILPHVCIKCGGPAIQSVRHTFRYAPAPFNIPLLEHIFGSQMTVHVPVCEAHRFHWSIYTWVGVVGFGILVSGFIVGMCAASHQSSPAASDTIFDHVLLSTLAFGAMWGIAVLYLHQTRIRAFRMTHDWMELVGVSPAFRDALEERRDEEADETVERKPSPDPNDPEAQKRRSQLIRELFGGKIQP